MLAGFAAGAHIGTHLGEQNAGDWATLLVVLAAGLAAFGAGFLLVRR